MADLTILGTGAYLPDRIVSNTCAGAAAGVDDAWIIRKTDIRERRWAAPGQATSDLATAAGQAALARAGITAGQVTLIVVATSTPDRPQPPTAAYVQHRLKAHRAAAFDLNAVCAGEVFALGAAEGVLARRGGHALVIGADLYSRILNPLDRRTAVLFGDGAGAMVLAADGRGARIRHTALHTFGDLADLIQVPAGGSRLPADRAAQDAGLHHFTMDGRAVRRFVQERLPPLTKQFLHESNVAPGDIRHFVPHQANAVLLRQLFADLDLPRATLHLSVTRYGNTGAASIPITLDQAARTGALHRGDLILLAGFGGGMSAGLALVEW